VRKFVQLIKDEQFVGVAPPFSENMPVFIEIQLVCHARIISASMALASGGFVHLEAARR
jgi:hypothetical protein